MAWAKRWITQQGWNHRLRLMLSFDEQKVQWHRRNVDLKRLAHMWKSYIAKDAFEERTSMMSTGGRP